MTRLRLLLAVGVAFILLILGLAAGVWWYLFGNVEIDSAELVPANTVFFASIPNAVSLLAGYQSSQLKTLLGSDNAKPVTDAITNAVGQKNLDLLRTFLPNLSGQSFIAVTHFDYDHPDQVGLIAAMKPKAGLGDFSTFLDQLKSTYPDLLRQGTTGTGTVEGVDYQWIQGPGATNKICVAQLHGWIVTTWGEATLQDWIERYRKQSNTTSLAHDLDYEKTLAQVGDNPMTLLFVNNHAMWTSSKSNWRRPIRRRAITWRRSSKRWVEWPWERGSRTAKSSTDFPSYTRARRRWDPASVPIRARLRP